MRRSQPAVREVSAWLDRSVCRCAVDRLEQLRSARADGRDRACAASRGFGLDTYRPAETEQEPVDASDVQVRHGTQTLDRFLGCNCLLYTSDAADDLTRVDLGGRR